MIDIKLEEGKFKAETIDVPLKVNGEDKVVVLRKLTAGQRGEVRKRCSKTRVIGNQTRIDIDDVELEFGILHSSIVEAPFPHTLNDVKNFPTNLFEYLSHQIGVLAGVDDKKKEE